MRRIPRRVVATLLLACALPSGATAADLRVPSDYATPGEALREAGDGDVVVLASGVYRVPADGGALPFSIMDKTVTLRGEAAAVCILDARGRGPVFLAGPGAVLHVEQVTLRNASAPEDAAVARSTGGRFEFVRCRFEGNSSTDGADVLDLMGSENLLRNCAFFRNGPEGPTILLRQGTLTVERCTLHENGGEAVAIGLAGEATIAASLFSAPGSPAGASIGVHLLDGARGVDFGEGNVFAYCLDGAAVDSRQDTVSTLLDVGRQRDARFDQEGADPLRVMDSSPAWYLPQETGHSTSVPEQAGAFGGPNPLTPFGESRRALVLEAAPALKESVPLVLGPAVPNPFTPRTSIHFSIATPVVVDLGVYNILGQRVRTLMAGDLAPGDHLRSWDGTDDLGVDVPPGIYFARITQGDATETRRLVLIR
ncbi:MAG: T9SS type A sorting domain-containing protein [Gemmatimonadota bacterium]|jgi:hypothetical protein|nr:T9SS type A sorting domain-containing protein [Gemmatimonadota bacterium]MDP6801932.1 T9SS type A sorting domain-containing protein [Gemmatimonadota bacterium]MDP7032353.1 T9SS type A sorting domain-containing protein [Gemmatimonadota bacterium]